MTFFSLVCIALIALGIQDHLPLGTAILLAIPLLVVAQRAPSVRSSALFLAAVVLLLGATRVSLAPLHQYPAPRTAPVCVGGFVSEPPRSVGRAILIPVAGVPPLQIPGEGLGPLPGSRVRAVGRIEAHGRWITVPNSKLIDVTPPPRFHLGARIESIRRNIRSRLEDGLAPRTAGLLRALLLGDRSLAQDDRSTLIASGTMHFFAVSGLHIGLVVLLLERVFGRRSNLGLGLALFYAIITGFRSPVGRALLLASFARIGFRRHRPKAQGRHLLIAATLLLAADPAQLRQVGFQLSFLACAGILFYASPYIRARSRDPVEAFLDRPFSDGWGKYSKHALLVGLAATFATAPITIIWFGRLTLASIPASLLVAPLMGPLLCVGVLKAILGAHPLPEFLAEALHTILIFLCNAVERLPGGSLELSHPSSFGLLLWGVSAACAAGFAARGQGVQLVGTMILGMGALLPSAQVLPNQSHLLDGGRGAAIFCALSSSHVLVDTGPRSSRIVEQLRERGIASVDALLLTHEHEDHAGGRPDVLASFQNPPVYAAFAGAHERIFRGSVRVPETDVLWPPRGYEPPNANDRSLVTRTHLGNTRFLITGDLEGPGMRRFLSRADPITSDLLVLPHHGARQPFLMPLLSRVQPSMSWLPARAGFPSEDVMLVRWMGIPMVASWYPGSKTWPPASCATECCAMGSGRP